jgi:integrase
MSRKRGNITKRGRNSWQVKFNVPSADGKRQQRNITVKGNFQDAQKELTRLLNAADTGTLPRPSAVTVAQYLDTWFAGAHERSPKTLERYRELAEHQIKPHIGGHVLQKLTPEHVQRWHGELLKAGLAPRTVGHANRLLRLVLGNAVKNRTLTHNVAAVHAAPKVEEGEIEILSPEQITTVLAALEGHSLYPIVALALGTGMRRGELLALQWADVGLDAGTLLVQRSLEETKAGLRFKPPKTRHGRRNIKLGATAVATLRDLKVQRMETRLAIGMGKLPDDELVFCGIEGEPLTPHVISRAWRRVVEAKGLPQVTFHALRHTHVSVLIAEKVDILTISRRIGHSKTSITFDVYGHLMPGMDEAAAAAIEGVLK